MIVSADMGKTWRYSTSPFPAIGGGQRVAFIKLEEGPLFFASFATMSDEGRPVPVINEKGVNRKISRIIGLFATVSYDDGKTWTDFKKVSEETRGYLSVCQGRNGLVHLITSKNHHAFNLKWLKTPRKL